MEIKQINFQIKVTIHFKIIIRYIYFTFVDRLQKLHLKYRSYPDLKLYS